MSNIIQLLEQLGQDASLQSSQAFHQAVENSSLTNEVKKELLQHNSENLEAIVGASKITCIGVLPAEDDDPSEEDEADSPESKLQCVA